LDEFPKKFRFFNMCNRWGRIRIWFGVELISRVWIQIHNTGFKLSGLFQHKTSSLQLAKAFQDFSVANSGLLTVAEQRIVDVVKQKHKLLGKSGTSVKEYSTMNYHLFILHDQTSGNKII
jgi:hypothetical protein